MLDTSSGERPVRISVAVNEAETEALKAGFGRDLLPGLALLAGLLLLAGWIADRAPGSSACQRTFGHCGRADEGVPITCRYPHRRR